ncbi:MAG TPA: TonB family protein [Blastocatellia bacterium]|nr:TonB family protein [Blastocatellia bacterium]
MSKPLTHTNSPSVAAPSPQLATPETDEWIRAALGKRFDIIDRLTENDTHFVYSARDLGDTDSTGCILLKVLRMTLAGDNRQVELFRLEAGAAARLSHKNIPKSTEAEEINGVHFSISEQRPGVITLRDHLERKGWLDVEEAVQVSQQIADALQHAHSRGILHLTLDPGKVLLDESGAAYVTGFGIDRAKDLLWARQERSRHCAARYITPEQILSGEVDQRTDLYLLGLILFEMLTDRTPFESEDEAELRSKHLARTPAPPEAFRQELSRDLSQTVLDLLSKRADGRPFYVSAFKSALNRCIASGLIHHEPDEEAEETVSTLEPAPTFEEPVPPVALVTSEVAQQNYEAVNEQFKDSDQHSEPVFTDVSYADEFQEPDIRFGDSTRTDRDVIEIPLQTMHERETGESIATRPLFALEQPVRVGYRRLAWLLILVLLAGGLFWTIRAGRFQGGSDAAVSGTVSNLQSNDEPSASNAERAPEVEPATTGAPEELPSEEKLPPDSALANLVMQDTLTEVEKSDRVIADKAKPVNEVEAEELSPPKRAEMAPPVISNVDTVFSPKTDSPAKPKELVQDNVQVREPAPAPQQPADPPAPKIIRKSGDVLQNTAIIRPRPLYPKEASKVKGVVTVEVTIDEEGSVISARPISGPEQLRDAALAAARRWKWVPERVDRNRARVVGTITLSFKD